MTRLQPTCTTHQTLQDLNSEPSSALSTVLGRPVEVICEGHCLVNSKGLVQSPENLFHAMLARLSTTLCIPVTQEEENWTHINNPPLLRPFTWIDRPPKIFSF